MIIFFERDSVPTIASDWQASQFERCCRTPDSAESIEYIEEYMKEGHDLNKINPECQKRPINFAVESLCKANLEALLSEPTVNIDQKCPAWSGMTPINYLAREIDDRNFKQVLSCIQVLVDQHANPNISDDEETIPIWHILKNENLNDSNKRFVLSCFLTYCFGLDLDNYHNGDARKLLKEQFSFPSWLIPAVCERSIDKTYELEGFREHLLKDPPDERAFIKEINSAIESGIDLPKLFNPSVTNDVQDSVFKLAVERGCEGAVVRMLRLGIDINFQHTIQDACSNGHWKIVKIFLRSSKTTITHDMDLLKQTASKYAEATMMKRFGYEKCFELLVNSPKIDLQYPIHASCSPFDVAVRYMGHRPDLISTLLSKGAYIGERFSDRTKDRKNAIENIDPEVLEHYLDSCIEAVPRLASDCIDFQFDYKNLVPPSFKLNRNLFNEMEPVDCMLERSELRHLINHPLIQSFLFIKWQRYAFILHVNLFIHVMFSVSILSYLLSSYIYVNTSRSSSSISWWASLIMTIVMVLRESGQFLLSLYTPKHFYWKSWQNYLEVTLLFLVAFVLCDIDTNKSQRGTIAAVIILLVTGELLILLGSLKKFFVHFEMLKSVLVSFVNAFALYVFILVAFAFCFFAILNDSSEVDANKSKHLNTSDTNSTEVNAEESESFIGFNTVGTSLMKVIVMATGEFDAGSINFDLNRFSYLLFLVFVFLVSTVLFNLLNGLAVADIQETRSQAESTNFVQRVYLLSKYESILSNQHPFRDWCPPFINQWLDPRKFSLFKLLKQYKILVYPSRGNHIFETRSFAHGAYRESRTMANDISDPHMPPNIMELVLQVLNKKKVEQREEDKEQQLYDRISNIEKTLAELSSDNTDKFESILSTLNSLKTSKH